MWQAVAAVVAGSTFVFLGGPPVSGADAERPAASPPAVPGQSSAPASGAAAAAAPATIQSDDASVHLTYASILFYKGRSLLQAGDREHAERVFKTVEAELRDALRLSEHDEDAQRRGLLRSQSAFLMGDLYFFVFNDAATAKAFYQESLQDFPEHEGAREALKQFETRAQ